MTDVGKRCYVLIEKLYHMPVHLMHAKLKNSTQNRPKKDHLQLPLEASTSLP